MSTIQTSYTYTHRGRSVFTVLVTGFVATLTFLFFLSRDPVFITIGVFFVFLVCSCIFAFLKGETWSINIEDGVLSWDYARWPRSSCRIDLSTVRAVVVSDWGSYIEFTFFDGSSRRLKLVGYAARLRDYLITHYPHIDVEFEKGS